MFEHLNSTPLHRRSVNRHRARPRPRNIGCDVGAHRELPGLRRRRSDPIRTLVDTWLARHPQVWAAAGHPHTVFSTTYAELLELTGGRAVDVER
jgi:prolyl-tRNA editing enzyme YbaK/EbsC (Cys-tRNA(Pro) deacylase)